MKRKILLFVSSIACSLSLTQCTKSADTIKETPEIVDPIETSYQLEIKVFNGLFNTPGFYQGALGGATCYAYLTYYDAVITEMKAGDKIIKQISLPWEITKEYKSDKYLASSDTEYLKLSCNVYLKIHKGDGTGINKPTMYRTIPVEFELRPYKGQANSYKITCGATANVLMIGGETARIDNW